ncbi:MAG: PAS domain-containing protein [Chitinophagaceae bacterium]|nr:PAS domain-containing protein [Oligoflexus sp.]
MEKTESFHHKNRFTGPFEVFDSDHLAPFTQARQSEESVGALHELIASQARLIEELTASKCWYETTFKSIGDGVIATSADESMTIEFMNQVAEELTGWKFEEACGKPVRDVFQIFELDTLEPSTFNPVKHVLKAECNIRLVDPVLLVSKDGNQYIIEDSAAPMLSAGRKLEGVVLIFRDATEKFRLEDVQKKLLINAENARQELAAFFMQAPAPMAILSGPDHVYTLANPLYIDFIGRDPLGKPAREVFNEAEGTAFFSKLDGVYKTGEPYIAKELELKRDLSIGRPNDLYVNINCHPFRDLFGTLKGILVFFQEVTDQVMARNAISESERYFRSLAETLPQIIWTADPRGVVNYTNGQWKEYANVFYPADWLSYVHKDDSSKAKQAWEHSIKTSNPLEVDVRLRSRTGVYRWFLLRATPTKDKQGRVLNWCGSATDIEERKNAAKELSDAKSEAERANATKSAFLANMSHEIRTPLGAILGFTELLRDPKTGEEERQGYLDIISRNGKALTRVIDDILDLSKVEAGHLAIERMPFRLPDLLSEITSLFSETVKAKNLYLMLAIDHNVPTLALSDPARLRQILINIIGNAVKFTSSGGIKVHVASQPTGPGKARITIAVSDTGPGLMRSQQKKLFQPFTQADNTTTRKYGGTGLGLALSRRLAQAMGGNIAISECKLRRGCTFQITVEVGMPASEPNREVNERVFVQDNECVSEHMQDDDSAKFMNGTSVPDKDFHVAEDLKSVPETAPFGTLSGSRVLLVEDAIDNQILIKRILAKRGAKVEVANNGLEGVEKALAGDYSIVLMDIQMPVMDGYQAIRKLRSLGYHGIVYALTAHAMAEERKKTHEAGYDGHLTKPLDTETLVQTVRNYTA